MSRNSTTPGAARGPLATARWTITADVVDDSMHPAWEDGATLLCKILEREGPTPGLDYLFEMVDGRQIIRRLMSSTGNAFTVAAVNQDTHPGAAELVVDDVARVSRIIGIRAPLAEPMPVTFLQPPANSTEGGHDAAK